MLLPYGPFVLFPDWPDPAAFWIIGSFVLAYLAIRALGLAWRWLAFPPIVAGGGPGGNPRSWCCWRCW